jgi:hypothetical protein
MTFTPESPAQPQDLYATFNSENQLTGLIYNSPDEGTYSRVRGEWLPLEGTTNPFGSGATVSFVDPRFIEEYDARMMYREYLPYEEVQAKFGVKPNFNMDFGN